MTILHLRPQEDQTVRQNKISELIDYFSPLHAVQETPQLMPVYRLPLDVYATPEAIVVKASLPGLNPDDIEVTLEDNALTIEGEMKGPQENVRYVLQQRPYGKFSRTLVLNMPVDWEHTEAHNENGVLTLVIPKAQEVKPKTIKIKSLNS